MGTRVQTIRSVELADPNFSKCSLAFQEARYCYGDGTAEVGYRFIWKNQGKLMAHRGQAIIRDMDSLVGLVNMLLAHRGDKKRLKWEE